MKTKTLWFLPMLLCFCLACGKEEQPPEGGFTLLFQPQECTHVYSFPVWQDQQDYHTLSKNSHSVSSDKFRLILVTGGSANFINDYSEYIKNAGSKEKTILHLAIYHDKSKKVLAPSILEIERQLDRDYRTRIGDEEEQQTMTGGDAMYFKPWHYRTTGIRHLSITADKPLFGQPAGTSLNPFFSIHELIPKQIISYKTKRLLWGYRDRKSIGNIDKWLSMSPMAQPTMILKLNAKPQETPCAISFTTTMETVNGEKLTHSFTVKLE